MVSSTYVKFYSVGTYSQLPTIGSTKQKFEMLFTIEKQLLET